MSASTLVYVVDDLRSLAELAGTILKQEHYETRIFHDPQAALAAFESEATFPELLVTDAEMPVMTGFDLIKLFRQKHPGVKSIVMSGSVDRSWLESQPVKPDLFLSKPYRPAELQRMARSLLDPSEIRPTNPV